MSTNPKDGVGAKKAPFRFVPTTVMMLLAPIFANGANKYGPFNWRQQKVSALTYVEAAQRHIYAWLGGQDRAEDSGLPHLDHAIASLVILRDAESMGMLEDDRFTPGPEADMLRALDKSAVAPAVSPEADCNCQPDWPEHAFECPLFHVGRS